MEYRTLREANVARQREWDPSDKIMPAYRGNELAGEVGEACNVVKKLERELGIVNGLVELQKKAQALIAAMREEDASCTR